MWELTDFVSFLAMSGAVVVFVVCSNVLCDKKVICGPLASAVAHFLSLKAPQLSEFSTDLQDSGL